MSGRHSALSGAAINNFSLSERRPWMRVAEYALTLLLAWAATAVSFSFPGFRETRLALGFAVILAASTLSGLGPAIAAILTVGVTASFYPRAWAAGPVWSTMRILPVLALLLPVVLTLFLTHRRRSVEYRLRSSVRTLKEQTALLMRAQQATRSAAWIFNTSTRAMRWYPGGAEIFGLPDEQVNRVQTPLELVLEEDRPFVEQRFETAIATGEPFHAEYRVRWPNGEIHWLEVHAEPVSRGSREWQGATLDISERKRAEKALIQNEKLAIAGRLAASIAHEINNPLEAVINLCYLARASSPSSETTRYIQMAEEELSRVAQITSQTLRFHRQQSAQADTDVIELAESVLKLYDMRLKERGLTRRLETRPVRPLRCYTGEIRQVLANLVGNAIDATPHGGTVCVRVSPATCWKTAKPAVRITVADTGHGMSPETLRRVCEPFYTTKDELGTGLGLWVSINLVERHAGRLAVRSRNRGDRTGTVFSVLVPYPRA